MNKNSPPPLLYLLFLVSGLTALVYEISWCRILSTIFGNTSLAIAIVVSIFMTGLAGGSFAAARLSRSRMNMLKIYALLEASIGLYAIFTPGIARWVEHFYASQYSALSGNFLLSIAYKAALASCLLVPPTLAMGATLPVLIQAYPSEERQSNAALLYGLNTAGAVAGTLLSGYLLLPYLGISRTIYLAAFANVTLAISAYSFSRSQNVRLEPAPAVPAFHPLYLLLLLTGFGALSYEILWTRALTMFFGSSVYAFSAILAAFLSGIAAGSAYYAKRIPRTMHPLQFFSLIQFRLALSGVFFVGVFMGLPIVLIRLFRLFHGSFPLFQLSQFLLITGAIFYTTFLSGATFPAALNFLRDLPERLSASAGYIYSYNTIGSILGSLCAGFVFIPILGVEKSIRVIILLNLILGSVCYFLSRRDARNKQLLYIAGATLVLSLIIPSWNQSIYNAGFYAFAYKYVPQNERPIRVSPAPPVASTAPANDRPILAAAAMHGPDESGSLSELNLIYYAEGLTANVAVIQDENQVRSLLINGKPDASNVPMGDMRTQLLLGHLPALLHPEAKEALVIGLGSGVTAAALSMHRLQRIDCVEIEKKVVEAARFFRTENNNILSNKNFHLLIDDGRNVVQHSHAMYDVITSEPSNLWMSGVANLFTREFFQAARKKLRPSGMMCQWIHLYQISLEDVLIFLKTFHSVFPHLSIWVDGSDMLVLGSDHPILFNSERVTERMTWPAIKQSMDRSGLTLGELSNRYVSDERLLAPLKKSLPINTDDLPVLEFSAARSLFLNQSIEIATSLRLLRNLADQKSAE